MKRFFLVAVVLFGLFFPESPVKAVEVQSGTQEAAYTGTMDLVKTTDGTFELNRTNSFTGTTTVQAGTLKITAGTLISSGGIILNGGTLELANSSANNSLGAQQAVPDITLNSGGTLTTTNSKYSNIRHITLNGGTLTSSGSTNTDYGTYLIGGKVTTTADSAITASKIMVRSVYGTGGSTGKWTVDNGATLSVSSLIRMTDSDTSNTRATLEKLGAGTLALTGTNLQFADGGTLKITEGVVTSSRTSLSGGATDDNVKLQFNGGTLQLTSNGNLYNEINVTADSTFVYNLEDHFHFYNSWTGSANLTYQSNQRAVGWLNGDMSGYTGTLILDATGSSEFFMTLDGSAQNSSSYAVHFADSSGRLALHANNASDTDFRVGMLSGNGQVRHYANDVASTVTLKVGNDTEYTDHTFGGRIYNNSDTQIIAVEKVGSNTWTLSGTNTYTGATTVSDGVLELTRAGSLTASEVTVNGGTLKNAGTIAKGITVRNGGTYESAGGTATEGLTIDAGGVLTGDYSGQATFAEGAILAFDLDAFQSMDLDDATFNGDIIIALTAADAESLYGQTFDLFKTDEADILEMISLNTANAPGHVNWITSWSNGLLHVLAGNPSSTPEPGTWCLLLLGCLYGFRRRRMGR
ncbi:MAG: autotransporter-associated beta strand repeat-containing protein [Planctomycetia bacterium]|nr:autotransporter-associated beta strand repeat-containing protein [Planctomycetia bacterium]